MIGLGPASWRGGGWRRAVLAALGFTAAAALVRQGLGLVAPDAVPFAPFFLAVMGAALVAGPLGGALAILFGVAATWILFFPRAAGTGLPDLGQTVSLLLFVAVSAAMTAVCSALRRALLQSLDEEERLNRVQEAGAVGDWSLDLRSDAVVWSRHLYRLAGRDPATFRPTPAGVFALVHPEDRDAFARSMRQAIEHGTRFELETRLAMPDGAFRHFVSRGGVVRAKDGKALRVVGVNIDVTDRRRAERELDEGRERYRALFEAMEEGSLVGELVRNAAGEAVDYRLLEANRAFETITGLRVADVCGRPQSEFAPEADPAWRDIYAKVVGDGAPRRTQRYVRRIDRWIDFRAFPLGGERFGAVFLDITYLKTAEIERDAAVARLSLAMENAKMGTWDVDLEKRTVVASESMDHMFGLDPLRPVKKVEDYTARMELEDAVSLRPKIEAAAAVNEPIVMEYRLLHPPGEVRWMVSRGAVLEEPGGGKRIVGAMFDITERKLLEAELRTARDRVELLFREMNHRTKNNLQIVSSLLGLRAAGAAGEEASRHMRAARERIATIAELHASLYQSDEIGTVELGGYIRNLCEKIEGSLAASAVRFEVRVETVAVPADTAVPLGLVVNEIVTNAIKHAFEPGQADATVSVGLRVEDGVILLTIADNGRGLPQGWGEGPAGLGTRLIKSFAQQAGGALTVTGETGTRFDLRIPKARS